MRCSLTHCLFTALAAGFLWLFLTLQLPGDMDQDRHTPRDRYGGRKAPRSPANWQDLTATYMKRIQQRRKTWLTVGISSGPGRDPYGLLYTLSSLFRASSTAEQKHLTVLVHLADADVAWLRETVARVARLFGPQVLAGRLVLIHTPSDAYSSAGPVIGGREARWGDAASQQNADHAFLASSAAGHSDYFLLLRDNVYCAPGFLAHIRRKVWALRARPWALLEFSNRASLAKLFRARDLPRLARYLLLFRHDQPLGWLIPRFSILQAQRRPILFRPFLFYYRVSYRRAARGPKAKAKAKAMPVAPSRGPPPGPHNPPGAVFTDMRVLGVHAPWEAYTLDESFFWTHNVSAGSHLTVILNRPASLSRVQVLTGTLVEGTHALRTGQVELGRGPEGVPPFCTSFVLLGPLREGQLDEEALPAAAGSNVSCVKLVVNADQPGGLMVRHVYLWEEESPGPAAVVAWG
uniref:MGAT4 conserved region domain-containing protein n=1 Tax=Pipistrellus kuhlii TaxID=59472 RepID=A0A7J7RG71_PIPKU|nr:hypothetical protein mPipKuh1_011513 [Pipistrellus kuhlii]